MFKPLRINGIADEQGDNCGLRGQCVCQVTLGLTTLPVNLTLGSALAADEISLWKGQQHAVYSRIFFGTVQELFLDAG